MRLVGGEQVRLEHPVHADHPFQRFPPSLAGVQPIQEAHDPRVGRLGLLRGSPQLGQATTPEVGMLRAVPHVTTEQQLHRQLRGQRDPAGERPHHPLLDVAVVANPPRRSLHGEGAGQRMGGHE
jgi:hypothetical protein